MHGFSGQQHSEISHKFPIGADSAKVELSTPRDHVVKYSIKRQLVLARPARDQLPDLGAVAPDECRCRSAPAMPRISREQPGEVAVVSLWRPKSVERLFLFIVIAKRLGEFM